MKRLTWIKIAGLSAAIAVLLSGCGGSEWGIDHATEQKVSHGPLDPNTGLYRCTIDDATYVEAGSMVRPLEEGTQLRVWHYENSDEYACVLKGDAAVSIAAN
jgi:hypothetical protein